jgi:serine/threonine protein phosphatase PrpC
LLEQVTGTPEAILNYIEKAIIAADSRIKEEGKKDKAKEGLGSTIVLAWLIGDHVYVGWCGDSRAYRYNPVSGLEQISHDHSYVQDLVDAGKLTPEQAFDHPHSNVITRSLGDLRRTARPDVSHLPACNDDIILLCSDGLCGVLRDREIEDILTKNTGSMEDCRNALWNESQEKGWHDNVTIALCQILSGGETAKTENKVKDTIEQTVSQSRYTQKKRILWLVIGVILVLLVAVAIVCFLSKDEVPKNVSLSVIAVPDQVWDDNARHDFVIAGACALQGMTRNPLIAVKHCSNLFAERMINNTQGMVDRKRVVTMTGNGRFHLSGASGFDYRKRVLPITNAGSRREQTYIGSSLRLLYLWSVPRCPLPASQANRPLYEPAMQAGMRGMAFIYSSLRLLPK